MAFYPLHPLQITEKDVYLPKKGITLAYLQKGRPFLFAGCNSGAKTYFPQGAKYTISLYINILSIILCSPGRTTKKSVSTKLTFLFVC